MTKTELKALIDAIAPVIKEFVDTRAFENITRATTPLIERIAALEKAPSLRYRGVWDASTVTYGAGDCVTQDGAAWVAIAQPAVGERPGAGATAWKLFVKRGGAK